ALSGEKWVAFPPRAGTGRDPYASALAQALAAAGLDASDIVPIDSLTAQKRMVEAGFGFAALPARHHHRGARARPPCPLRPPAVRITVAIVLIHRRRAFQSGATRGLVSLLTDWA